MKDKEKHMLHRDVQDATAANAVLYSHSEHGSSCGPIIILLGEWAVKHRKIMLAILKN